MTISFTKFLRLKHFAAVTFPLVLLYCTPSLASQAANPSSAEASAETSWLDKAAAPIQLKSDEVTLKLGAESRYRLEYRDDFNLAEKIYEDDAVNLFRNRINADFKITPKNSARSLRLFTEGQSALSFAENGLNKSNQFVNRLDLRQLFVEIPRPIEQLPVTLKAGRQELIYGDERFVGALNWTNVARVFDAVKAIYDPWNWFQWDIFYAQPVRTIAKGPDKTIHSDHFYGLYGSYKRIKDHTLDSFLFIRHISDSSLASERAGQSGQLTEYTFGNRLKGKKGAVDYGMEYALQLGRKAHDEIEAWAFHQELGYTFKNKPLIPRVYTEFNHASGDRNPTDGIVSTFDNLFPTNHNKYGLIDFLSLKNMNDVMLGVSAKPHSKISTAAEFHWFFLDAKESPWFNASGGNFRAANPNASTQLGEEIDLYANYALNKYFSFLTGYSHFFAGPFTDDSPGGNDDANFFYSQLTFKI